MNFCFVWINTRWVRIALLHSTPTQRAEGEKTQLSTLTFISLSFFFLLSSCYSNDRCLFVWLFKGCLTWGSFCEFMEALFHQAQCFVEHNGLPNPKWTSRTSQEQQVGRSALNWVRPYMKVHTQFIFWGSWLNQIFISLVPLFVSLWTCPIFYSPPFYHKACNHQPAAMTTNPSI